MHIRYLVREVLLSLGWGQGPKTICRELTKRISTVSVSSFPEAFLYFFVGPVHGEAEKDSPRWRSAMRFMFEDMHRKYKRAVTPINVLSL